MAEMFARPSRRAFLAGGAMALAGGAGIAAQPRRLEQMNSGVPLAGLVPETIGGWRVDSEEGVVLPEADVPDQLYDAVLARSYAGSDLPAIMLSIAHGGAQSMSMTLHRPETCYAAAGFTVVALGEASWPIAAGAALPGRVMTARREDRTEQVGYWRRISDAFPTSRLGELRVIAARNIAGVIPDGVLVRFSTVDADAARGRRAIAGFATALSAALDPAGRALLLGDQRRGRPPNGRSTTMI